MRATPLACCVMLALAAGAAPARAQEIQTLLAKPDVLCGRFDQAKTLVGLKKPVRSSGRFCIVANKGVLWDTQLPFASALRLTRSEIVESEGDHITKRLSASQEPAVRLISDLLLSLLAGDMTSLNKSFTIDATMQAPDWHARLTPKEESLKRVVGEIEMSGARFVSSVGIHEAGGDRTEIRFSELVTGAKAMTPDEARQFEAPDGSAAH